MPEKLYHIILSVGCNCLREQQVKLACKALRQQVYKAHFTDILINPAIDMPEGTADYANLLVEGYTSLSITEMTSKLKTIEKELGDNRQKRAQGVVMMDLDLIEYDGERLRQKEWHRPHVKFLMKQLQGMMFLALLLFSPFKIGAHPKALAPTSAQHATSSSLKQESTTLMLTRAIDYYNSGKYHESILMFERLQRTHTLNPRFKAYLGHSYYKLKRFQEAIIYLQDAIPQLGGYAPIEQAAYMFACAESLFETTRYHEAITFYDMALPLVNGNDKADILFRKAFAHYFLLTRDQNETPSFTPENIKQLELVKQMFSESLEIYIKNTQTATDLQTARQKQCGVMINGIKHILGKETYFENSNITE